MKIRIGIAQLNSQGDKQSNLLVAESLIKRLAQAGSRLVLLPEHFDFIGPDQEKPQQAESLEGSSCLSRLRELAAGLNLYLHVGSFLEKDGDKIFNTAVVFDPTGEIIAKYRKIHLFDVEVPGGRVYRESDTISAGSETVLFRIDDFIFGMATCYDLRFPELFRNLVMKGANVLLLPAAFTLRTGKDHWELLLRARAVENQCWVAAAGQWGKAGPDHDSFGRSMVVDPWGLVIAQAVDDVSTITAELDMARLQEIRASFPVLDHIRDDLF